MNKRFVAVLIIVIGMALIVFSYTIKTDEGTKPEEEKEEEQEEQRKEEEKKDQEEEPITLGNNTYYDMELNIIMPSFTIEDEKLEIEFEGTEFKDGYKYSAFIKLNGKEVKQNFFNGSNIYSSNMTGTFRVYKIDDIYLLVSGVAAQCGGKYILVMNTDGTVLNTFDNVELDFPNVSDQQAPSYQVFTITKYNECSVESTGTTTKYKVSKKQLLVEQ